MNPLNRRSVVEQSADYLREALSKGTWSGRMPGVVRLAAEAGVSKLTMRAALRILEEEGLVVMSENGYSRYAATQPPSKRRQLRIGILMAEPLVEQIAQFQQLMIEVQHHLAEAGFLPFVFNENLRSLRYDVRRIGSVISKSPVDACIVVAGSREVLEWFSTQPFPCLAIFGRCNGLPIARIGPDKTSTYVQALRHLIQLGHKRIVLLNRKERRHLPLGKHEQTLLDELEAGGITPSRYNMPAWEETPQGFHSMLAELFRVTPPTALLFDEVPMWVAAQQFLALNRIRVPEQVSLVAGDNDPNFFWCSPEISHIRWEIEPIIRFVDRWAKLISQGKEDTKQVLYPAEFVRGGTIGPAPGLSIKSL